MGEGFLGREPGEAHFLLLLRAFGLHLSRGLLGVFHSPPPMFMARNEAHRWLSLVRRSVQHAALLSHIGLRRKGTAGSPTGRLWKPEAQTALRPRLAIKVAAKALQNCTLGPWAFLWVMTGITFVPPQLQWGALEFSNPESLFLHGL